MSSLAFVLIPENIEKTIVEGRKKLWKEERIRVFVKSGGSSTYDVLNMISLAIGIKVDTPATPGQTGRVTNDGRVSRQYGRAVSFGTGEVNQEALGFLISLLINTKFEPGCKYELQEGVPLKPTWIKDEVEENNKQV